MSSEDARWAIGPFGLDAGRAATYSPERTVLAVVHHMTAANRLADVMPLVESDRRIQVIYTCPPTSIFPGWAQDYLRRMGAVVIPWQQAVQQRFDLAVSCIADAWSPPPWWCPPGVISSSCGARG
jgi:hypothetical protein